MMSRSRNQNISWTNVAMDVLYVVNVNEKKFHSNYQPTIDSDNWASGGVFYFFITEGNHPFEDENLNCLTILAYNSNCHVSIMHILNDNKRDTGESTCQFSQPCFFFFRLT